MPTMTVIPDLEREGLPAIRKLGMPIDRALAEGAVIHLTNPIDVGALEHGMSSGKASVMFGFELPDGRVVVAETSLALFVAAARALDARYGPAA